MVKRFVFISFIFIFIFLKTNVSYSSGPENKFADNCIDTLWKHVYNPSRLILKSNCITVRGIVRSVKTKSDGDTHIFLRPDPGQDVVLSEGNFKSADSTLILEVVCTAQIRKIDAKCACKNYHNNVILPFAGQHIEATGSSVIDTHHNWLEIHPVSFIKVL